MKHSEQESAIQIKLMNSEPFRFVLLTVLGVVASYVNVRIPYTEVFIEGRWLFGFMGFALLRHWWTAFLLACILSITTVYEMSFLTVLVGNMLYAFPILLVIRLLHARFLARLRNLIKYGVAWLLLILVCYQVFTTPVIWGFLAFLDGQPIWQGMLRGWCEQPFLIESLLVGIISALAMMVVRSTSALRASQRELATTLYSIGDAVIATDIGGRIARMNPVAESLTGWREGEAVGKPLDKIFYILNEETREPIENPVQRILEEGCVVGLANHTLLMARDGTECPIVDSGAPIRDENNRISGVVLVFRDQTEERAAQKILEESNDRLLLALRNARMGIWEWNIATQRMTLYGEYMSLLGISVATFDGNLTAVQKCVHPDDWEPGRDTFYRMLEVGSDFDYTYRIVWPDGSVHWMRSYGKLEYDEYEKPRRILGTTQDITERRRQEQQIKTALAEKETLLRELYHRTKNTMQIICALLDFQAELSGDTYVLEAFAETQNRIQSMALVHEQLYQSQDLSRINLRKYVYDLANLLMKSYQISLDNVNIMFDMEDVLVLIDSAIPCGLILNELISNAFKYAFPGDRHGEIHIHLSCTRDNIIELCVADNGVGVPANFDFRRDGRLGLENIFSLGEGQLRGHVQFTVHNGITCCLHFRDNLHAPRV